MGLFSKFGDAVVVTLNAIGKKQERLEQAKHVEYLEQQGILHEYRSRGIYVLAVYVDGILWNYFHYPSEDHRNEAATEFWPRFFNAQRLSSRCELLDPA